jgi:hypothetical protein
MQERPARNCRPYTRTCDPNTDLVAIIARESALVLEIEERCTNPWHRLPIPDHRDQRMRRFVLLQLRDLHAMLPFLKHLKFLKSLDMRYSLYSVFGPLFFGLMLETTLPGSLHVRLLSAWGCRTQRT